MADGGGTRADAAGAAAAAGAPMHAPVVAECWEVWRQDDNGNRYLVAGHAEQAAARRQLDELESGLAHKQSYWLSHRIAP